MKKIIAISLLIIIAAFAFAGCASPAKTEKNKPSVVATIFPGFDFARAVCGDTADTYMLLPPGGESHSYEPTAQDIILIGDCDLFIYVGGESDAWVEKILNSLDKPVKTLRMFDAVDAVEETIKEGMEAEHGEESDEKEYDEHIWTSPKNAVKITNAVADAMCEADANNADAYHKNSDAYVAKLQTLDGDFEKFFSTVENKTMIFGDRFPMRYFTDAYGIDYYAAFPGCASETEPSAATIAFLIGKIKEEKLSTVYYIEFSNHKVADSIAEATGTKTAQINTCHNVTKAQLESGATYLSLMRENLETLKVTMK